jgi:glucose/arabinose dehydrogenase
MKGSSFAFVSLTVLMLMASACANKNGSSPLSNPADSNTSVETGNPNTDYKPAFLGQTRIKAVKTTAAYEVLELADGMGRPWAVVPLPDGRLLITEKSGYMEIRDQQGKLLSKVTGFAAVDDRGQGGMLDVAPDPDFAQNKIIYWAYSEKYGNGNLTSIAKGKLSADEKSIEQPTVIFRATPALNSNLHFGCRLLFDKDGFLYASVGERSILEGRKQAQWLNAGLGKIFRLTKDGKAAPGNPFAGTANAMPEIWSYGHRNPQSLAWHPATGELWEAEFGPRGGDELNLIKPGKNYGWPVITYGIEYGGSKVGEGITQKDGLEQPVYYWDPVISPSGMCFYEGDAMTEWKNNLFIACLSGLHVARLVIENNKVVGEERLLTDQTERFRDIACLNGKLYVVTDSGMLLVIKKK